MKATSALAGMEAVQAVLYLWGFGLRRLELVPLLLECSCCRSWKCGLTAPVELTALCSVLRNFPMKATLPAPASTHEGFIQRISRSWGWTSLSPCLNVMPFTGPKAEENKTSALRSREDWPLPEPLQCFLQQCIKWGRKNTQGVYFKMNTVEVVSNLWRGLTACPQRIGEPHYTVTELFCWTDLRMERFQFADFFP